MFKCNHVRKEKFLIPIKSIMNVSINGKECQYQLDNIQLYKCHDCKCIVWEDKAVSDEKD